MRVGSWAGASCSSAPRAIPALPTFLLFLLFLFSLLFLLFLLVSGSPCLITIHSTTTQAHLRPSGAPTKSE